MFSKRQQHCIVGLMGFLFSQCPVQRWSPDQCQAVLLAYVLHAVANLTMLASQLAYQNARLRSPASPHSSRCACCHSELLKTEYCNTVLQVYRCRRMSLPRACCSPLRKPTTTLRRSLLGPALCARGAMRRMPRARRSLGKTTSGLSQIGQIRCRAKAVAAALGQIR